MIRVELPAHLRTLAQVRGEVELEVAGAVTQQSILDTLDRIGSPATQKRILITLRNVFGAQADT